MRTGAIAPFDLQKVSLPSHGARAVPITDVLSGSAKHFVEGFKDSMLLDDGAWGEIVDVVKDIPLYTDPVLASSRNQLWGLSGASRTPGWCGPRRSAGAASGCSSC